MPWTFAHPAILRPLSARLAPINLYGALLGALMPDVGYYLGSLGRALSAHSLPGLFQVCLPFSWLFLLLSVVLAQPMIDVLPAPHRPFLAWQWQRVIGSWRWTVRAVLMLSACMLLGSFSHLLWDSATHRTGLWVPALNLTHTLYGVPIFRWLQHLSTVVGSVVLLLWYRQSLRQFASGASQTSERKGIAMVIAVLSLIAAFAAFWAWHRVALLPSEWQVRAFFFQAAVLAAQITLISWILIAVVVALWRCGRS